MREVSLVKYVRLESSFHRNELYQTQAIHHRTDVWLICVRISYVCVAFVSKLHNITSHQSRLQIKL